MNPDFSERQFETAVNIELVSTLAEHMSPAIPVVPTTNQEGHEGWDALFKLGSGYWYFLQYKVSIFASRRTSWNEAFWAAHRCPYFRFHLHMDSNGECRQHRLLTELRLTQPGVYYCTPAFVKEEELWERAASSSVLDGSRLLDVSDLHLPDPHGQHQVSFDDTGRIQVWSEQGEPSMGDRSASIRRSEENRQPIDRASVGRLLRDASLIAASARRGRGRRAVEAWARARFPQGIDLGLLDDETAVDRIETPDLLATTSRILQLDFGLTWVIDPTAR